jgi:hypothetical protein
MTATLARGVSDRLLYWCYVLGELLSPPLRFDRNAKLAVHTLIGHEAVVLHMFSARSLCRHLPGSRLVLHDDGTLSLLDRLLLRLRMRGATIIRKRQADALVAHQLARYPRLLRARAENVRLCQIIDYCVLASTDCILGMDSDVIFLARPESVLAWVSDNKLPSTLYSPERDPKGPHWAPALMPGAPYVADMCCGFVCMQPSSFFAPGPLENFVVSIPRSVLDGRRFVTQMLYSLMAARPGQNATSLGPLYESGRMRWLSQDCDRVICHYFASHERSGAVQNLIEERELFAQLAHYSIPKLAEQWHKRWTRRSSRR